MPMLSSLPGPCHAVVIGHSGAIGGAVVDTLLADDNVAQISAGARRGGVTRMVSDADQRSGKVAQWPIDIGDEASIIAFAKHVAQGPPPRLILLTTGLLQDAGHQPEKRWQSLDAAALQRSFLVNTIGPALVAKHLLPLLPRSGKAVFAVLSARVGSISDNRLGGWYGYRASKAALNMLVKTLSIELARNRPEALCVSLHPGTVDSALSRPFQANVAPEKLFTPAQSARHLLQVIDSLSADRSGELIGWDGQTIPF